MYDIAICDDQEDQLALLKTYLDDYAEKNSLEIKLSQFSHPDVLLDLVRSQSFDLYILDIVMPRMNGIELAKEIRLIDREAQIIHVSTEPSFAFSTFSANPLAYLVKPLKKQELFQSLNFALSKIKKNKDKIITVETKQGPRLIPLSSLLACENKDQVVYYYLLDGECLTSETKEESFTRHIEVLLADPRFIQPHKSFLVNMSRVEAFSKSHFLFKNNLQVPISCDEYASVRDQYLDFILDNEACL